METKLTLEEVLSDYEILQKHFFVHRKNKKKLSSLKDLKGVENCLNSFATPFFFQFNEEQEWNPINQRLLVRRPPARWPEMDECEKLNASSIALVEMFHEIFHIVFLEPFFSGQETFKSKQQFTQVSLVIEAFCYWYGDAILTRQLRFLNPDQEPVFYKRKSASSPFFHPYRVFEVEGIKDTEKILDIYINAFLGFETEMIQFQSSIGKSLTSTVYGFYAQNNISIGKLYDRLNKIGVWKDFYNRFCFQFENTSLVPKGTISFKKIEENPHSFIQMARDVLKSIRNISPSVNQFVQNRRRIQTEAYFLYCALFEVQSGNVVDISSKKLKKINKSSSKKLISLLNSKVFELESQISQLIKLEPQNLEAELSKWRLTVSKTISYYGELRIERREQIYPYPGPNSFLGLATLADVKTSPKRQHLLQNLDIERSPLKKYSSADEKKERLLLELEFLKADTKKTTISPQKLVTRYNHFFLKYRDLDLLKPLWPKKMDHPHSEISFRYR